jgi:HNH endonuclease
MPKGVYFREDVDERFWRQVDLEDSIFPENGCMLWTGCKDKTGYGKFKSEGQTFRSHRWSYERLRGSIPNHLKLDHLCRVRHCVNPDHLQPVSPKENIRRGMTGLDSNPWNRGKTHCIHGHEFTPENTYQVIKDGTPRRYCRACQKESDRRHNERKRESRE